MLSTPLRFGATALLLASALAVSAFAQSTTGSIEGSVTDATGAVVPGAEVTATHVATATEYPATTNEIGRFALPTVRLGEYVVLVSSEGFNTALVEGVTVEVGQTAQLTIPLDVGDVATEVTVSASAAQALVNTTNAELGTVVDQRQVLELPLNGRNAVELAIQQAGVNFERSPDGQGNKFFVNGQRHRSVNFSLDGLDTQDNLNRSSATIIDQPLLAMSAENVQEFKVVTGIASAEYGRGGAQITAVTRSGSNEWHGSLFNFHRNTVLNANDFFNNSSGVDRSPLIRNQFGGRIGGPIVKNKTFFFFGYQQTREARSISVNRTVYTAQAKAGQFRFLDGFRNSPSNAAANPDAIRTVNLMECGGGVAALERDCVDGRFDAGNPASFDPFITGTIFGVMPDPNNFDVGDGLNTGGFRWNAPSRTFEHLPAFRLDHQVTDKHLFYGTFNYTDREIEGDFINDREPIFPALEPLGNRVTHSRAVSLNLVSTLKPTVVNEFRAGFVGGNNAFPRNQPFGTPYTIDLNTISDVYDAAGGTTFRDNEFLHIRDTISWIKGKHQIKAGFEWRRKTVDVSSFFGVATEYELDDNDFTPGFDAGDLETLGGGDINTNDRELAQDLMNNLVGGLETARKRFNAQTISSGFVPDIPERHVFRNWETDFFLQDQWQVRPGLTVNLGVRYEFASVPVDRLGLLLTPTNGFDDVFGVSGFQGFFNPGTLNGSPCPELSSGGTDRDAAIALIRNCATTYSPATPVNGQGPLWNPDKNNWAPIVSIAWRPDSKTTVRTGFRVSYMQDAFSLIDGNLDDNEGLTVSQACVASNGECTGNAGSLPLLRDLADQGIQPVTPDFVLPSSRSILDSSTIDFRAVDQNLATPYYNEWTFGINRELSDDLALEVRYVGNRGVKLRRVADFNEMNVNAVDPATGQRFIDSFNIAQQNLACNRANGSSSAGFADSTDHACIQANPFMAALISGDAARLDNRTALMQALEQNEPGQFIHRLTQVETSRVNGSGGRIRGGSFWGEVLDGRFPVNLFQANPFVASSRGIVGDGFSTYHALQIDLRRRYSQGLFLNANYTFGKALADFDGDQNTLVNDTRPSSVVNKYYTLQQYMPRHQFKLNWSYELPIGSGKSWNPGSPVVKGLLAGWQMGGLMNYRTGRPYSIVSGRGAFHRTAVSDENTVDLSEPLTRSDLRGFTGRVDSPGGVFFMDPCLSEDSGADCTTPGAVPGLFRQPAAGQLGSLGLTPVFGPQRFLFDFNLMKRFAITEEANVEFRWEIFNVFNNVNFALPENDVFDSNFGQITRTVSEPRLMQFALKFNF